MKVSINDGNLAIVFGLDIKDTSVSGRHWCARASFEIPEFVAPGAAPSDPNEFALNLATVILAEFAKRGFDVRPRLYGQYKLEHAATLYVVEALAKVSE